MLSLFSLAVHRPFRPVAVVGVLAMVSGAAEPDLNNRVRIGWLTPDAGLLDDEPDVR
ncbi:hypothetical protein [Streptomyces xantholiticus]|uniref:hypothetical protein n=1 Tax=Streptomyces xantholiticus TaxID=68285 RepID=UPI003D9EB5D2